MLFSNIPAITLAILGTASLAKADTLTRYIVQCDPYEGFGQYSGYYIEIHYDSWRLGKPMTFIKSSSCAVQSPSAACGLAYYVSFSTTSGGHTFTYNPELTTKDKYKLDGVEKTLPNTGVKIDVGNSYPQDVCNRVAELNNADRMSPGDVIAETYYNLPNI